MWIECANKRQVDFRDAHVGGKWEKQMLPDRITHEETEVNVCIDHGPRLEFNGNNRAQISDKIGAALVKKYPQGLKKVGGPGPESGRMPLTEFLEIQRAAPAEEVTEEAAPEPVAAVAEEG